MDHLLLFDQYLDSDLENLSPELTRNFKLIHDLDLRVKECLEEIDKLKVDYLADIKTFSNEVATEKMKDIEKKYEKCREYSEEKVQLANQTYEMVDKHIRRLDTSLARFEAELKEHATQRHHTDTNNDTISSSNATMLGNSSNSFSLSTDQNQTVSKRKKKKSEHPAVIV
jgi:chromosome segregation ATPase